jgi:PKD repeat protein
VVVASIKVVAVPLHPALLSEINSASYYTQIGQYPVKLVVTGPGGCKDSTSKVLNVYDPREGKLNYFPLTGCRPLNVNLEAFSQYNANFIWDFGDGNINESSINKLIHTYNDAGDFIPKIIVKQLDGCVLTIKGIDTIQIFGAKAKFNLLKNQFCDSGYINIIDSTITRDSILSYKWDFGDGTTSTQLKPGHYYYKPGNYPVSLIVRTEKGCIDTARINVKVIQSPLISVKTDTVICINETLLHMGIMERPDSSIVKWRWTFPNGNISGNQNPIRRIIK